MWPGGLKGGTLVAGSLIRPRSFPTPRGSTKSSISHLREAVFTCKANPLGMILIGWRLGGGSGVGGVGGGGGGSVGGVVGLVFWLWLA